MIDINGTRPVWLEVNLDNLIHNYNNIRSIVSDNTMIMAVIKGNGYGHGSVELAKIYKEIGVDRLAVSVITEAVELRKAGIEGPIQLLSYTPEGQIGLIIDYDIIESIYTYADAEVLSKIAGEKNKSVKIHLKIDTGMGRIGFMPNEASIEEIIRISKLPNIEIEGIFTHFASADELNKDFTKIQYERFKWIVSRLIEIGINIKVKHVSNSAAIMELPEYNLDMVRPGIILYGYYPSEEVDKTLLDLIPAISLKGRISNIKTVAENIGISYGHVYHTSRESRIATVPLGYADGYSRMFTGKSYAYYKGYKVPIVGTICMDQMMIDVTEVENSQVGDEIVFFGPGGNDYPQVEELARILGTISYELLCMMGRRLPRVYLRDNRVVCIKDYLLDDLQL